MTRFEVTLRCETCHHKYKRIMRDLDQADPPCPRCAKPARLNAQVLKFNGKAPSVGGSLVVKATDYTAQATMEDYGMTDLRSDVREGETAAPKLAPHMQAQADSFFGGGGRKRVLGMNPGQIMKAAVGGRFSSPDSINPVQMQHQRREKPAVNVVASDEKMR